MQHQAVLTVMAQRGGVATWAELRKGAPKREIERAREAGSIVRTARGRYATPTVEAHRAAAHAMTAVLSHASAAAAWGLSAKHEPARPSVTVRRHRNLSAQQRAGIDVTWRALSPSEIRAGITDPVTTVVDCARTLPFDEGLSIADSALRIGVVEEEELRAAARVVKGPGAQRVRRVLREARGNATNPLESCLRAIALDVPGLRVRPQVVIADTGIFAMVDLGDETLQIAIEAEGYETHGKQRKDFEKDCARYVDLAALGWVVLRFTWPKVMVEPRWVQQRLVETVARRTALVRRVA